jgi:predicted Fe-Mo cluster-binding NifX family protein
MGGLTCPHCGERIDVFGRDGAQRMAEDMGVELLVSLPLDGEFATWADRGGAGKGDYHDLTGVAEALDRLVEKVAAKTSSPGVPAGDAEGTGVADDEEPHTGGTIDGREDGMEIYAIPTENGVLCAHFGHCAQFTLVEAEAGKDPAVKEICDAPPHEPGLLPRWLAEKGVSAVIAGGMGARAQQIFAESGVRVMCGAPSMEPLEIVKRYVDGNLELGDNICDH